MENIWNPNDKNKLYFKKNKFASLVPLKHYNGTFKMIAFGREFDLDVSLEITFTLQRHSSKVIEKLYNEDKEKWYTVKIEKSDILKHVESAPTCRDDKYSLILNRYDFKSDKGFYFRFNKEQLMEFAGIDSTSSYVTVKIGDKSIKTKFAIYSKNSLKGNSIKNYFNTHDDDLEIQIIKNEFKPSILGLEDINEEYLNKNSGHGNPTLFDF